MMTILFKYTFKQFLSVNLILTVLIVAVLWLAQSLRFIDLIMSNSISLKTYFSLVVFLIPDILVIISPIATAVSGLFCFHKMITQRELIAFRSLGLSNFQVALPMLVLSFCMFLALTFMNIYVVPQSFQKFRQQEHILRNAFSGTLFKEGSFNTMSNITIYVKEHGEDQELKNIFIYQSNADKDSVYTTIAKSGKLFKKDESIFITLSQGQRQEYNKLTNEYNILHFDEFIYDLSKELKPSTNRQPKAYEKPLRELFFPDESLSENMQMRYRAEGHQRLIFPFLGIVDALMIAGFMLAGELSRRFNRKKLVMGAISVLFAHVLLMIILQMAARFSLAIPLAYLFISLLFVLSGYFLLKERFIKV